MKRDAVGSFSCRSKRSIPLLTLATLQPKLQTTMRGQHLYLPLLVCLTASLSLSLAQHQEAESTLQLIQRQLEESTVKDSLYKQYITNVFAEGESDWDEFQQAWRMLGFFIDCEDSSRWHDDDDVYGYNNHGGSGDEGTPEGCNRYVLWAAYVDENYQGDGIGEYQYYDRSSGKWDTTPCSITGTQRCAKMDCHLSTTSWTLLGLFKHKEPDDWMEQLFKHEGMCIWTDEEYSFMKNARKSWPKGCIMSSSTTVTGSPIYYDIKPVSNGGIKFGLYTDNRCVEEYQGTHTVEQVVGNPIGSAHGSHDEDNGNYADLSFSEAQTYWDSAFDIFKICQPCVAHDLYNYGYGGGSQGANYGRYANNDDGGGQNYDMDDFDCYDDAGYQNVNQCMKFMAKTSMDTATMRDVVLASRQGTLVDIVPVAGLSTKTVSFVKVRRIWSVTSSVLYLVVSMLILLVGALLVSKAKRDAAKGFMGAAKQPLVID